MSATKVCPADHKHGETGTCYVIHKCRCLPCKKHNAAAEQRRTRLKAYGRYDNGLVDAGPVREHVQALRAAGLGYVRIARLAGVQPRAVGALLYGRQEAVGHPRHGEVVKRMKRESAEAIMAVQPSLELLGARVQVQARPYVRRCQALIAMGWSQSHLAGYLGMSRSNFRLIRVYERAGSHRNRVTVRAETARRIVAMYDDLSNRVPPVGRGRTLALQLGAEKGWPLPMDWESIDNDFERVSTVRRSAA